MNPREAVSKIRDVAVTNFAERLGWRTPSNVGVELSPEEATQRVLHLYGEAGSVYDKERTPVIGHQRENGKLYDITVQRGRGRRNPDYTLAKRLQGTEPWEGFAIIHHDGILTRIGDDEVQAPRFNSTEDILFASRQMKLLRGEQHRLEALRKDAPEEKSWRAEFFGLLSESKLVRSAGAVALIGALVSGYNTYQNHKDAELAVAFDEVTNRPLPRGQYSSLGETVHPGGIWNRYFETPVAFSEQNVPEAYNRPLAVNNTPVEPGQVRQIIFRDRWGWFLDSKYCQVIPVTGVDEDSVLVSATDSGGWSENEGLFAVWSEYSYEGRDDLTITLREDSIRACNSNPHLKGDDTERVVFEIQNP